LLVSLPIFYPIVVHLGYDPIWFGQVITVVVTMGSILPPIGICCYIVAGMAPGISLTTVFRGAFWYVPAYLLTIMLLILFPYWTVLVVSNLVK
jgi:TRAP-type C4-dicarboxylate transport system permease large subunit